MAVNRVPCYQRGDGGDPEKRFIDRISYKGTDEMNG